MTRMMFPTASAPRTRCASTVSGNLLSRSGSPRTSTRRSSRPRRRNARNLRQALMAMAVSPGRAPTAATGPGARRAAMTASYVPPGGPGAVVGDAAGLSRARCCPGGARTAASSPGPACAAPAPPSAIPRRRARRFHRDAQEVWQIGRRAAGAAPGRALLGRRSGQDADAGRSPGLHRDRSAEAAQRRRSPTRHCSTRR